MKTIEQEYADARPQSKALHERAIKRMPSGVAHDGRAFAPFPFYVARADGARKWDVDGHEYIDCWSGHGALMLGHNHPAVLKAIQEQAKLGTHYSACSEIEVRWAELICSIVPGAERVRFMMTGTETTALAIRVARAVTGRQHIVKFEAHFHGLHDAVMAAVKDPFEIPVSAGVPPSTLSTTLVARNNDIAHVRELLDEHPVAAVILEPAGARSMVVPTNPAFLRALRELTRERGVVLIFDEVITGFRLALGGAQELYGVRPDLTCLGKIIGGGLPVGAYGGGRDVMDQVAPLGAVYQAGTLSGNPLAVAAGLATLKKVLEPGFFERLSATT
jgi:glutamate-1-semialdehyde 2,1-aminomutase